jgi:hypothetical protein
VLEINLIRIFSHNPPVKFFDLGIAYIAAYLKQNNVKVDLRTINLLHRGIAPLTDFSISGVIYENWDLPINLNFIRNNQNGKPLCYNLKNTLKKYYDKKLVEYDSAAENIERICMALKNDLKHFKDSKTVGFKVDCQNSVYVVMASLLLKQINPGIRIIYGGPHPTLNIDFSKIALKTGIADVVVIGEGEETLLKVLKNIDTGVSYFVDGTMTYDKNSGLFNKKPPVSFVDLNKLPCPDFSGQDIPDIEELTVHANRGCVFSCSFCNSWCTQNKYRQMNYVKVVDTMEYLSKKYNKYKFDFTDAAINYSIDWLEKFADELLNRKLQFKWHAFFSPAMNISQALAKKLRDAGLIYAVIGIESFSDKTLENMNRPCNARDNLSCIHSFASLGIDTRIDIIAGFPGESDRDFYQTMASLELIIKKYAKIFVNPAKYQVSVNSFCFLNPKKFNIRFTRANALKNFVVEIKDIVKKMPLYFKLSNDKNIIKRFYVLMCLSYATHVFAARIRNKSSIELMRVSCQN